MSDRALRSTEASSGDHEEPTLGDRTYALIKRAIIRCDFRPGEDVTESQLAAMCGTGKAPVRNALARLQQEGLVESRARRGYVVAPVTIRDAEELYAIRLLIEPEIARLAAGRVDGSLLHTLDRAVESGYVPGDRESEAAFIEANRTFHLTIAEAAGNRRLYRMLAQVIEQCDRVLHVALAVENSADRFQHAHRELIAALKLEDGELAASLSSTAIAGGRDTVVEALLSSPSLREVGLVRL